MSELASLRCNRILASIGGVDICCLGEKGHCGAHWYSESGTLPVAEKRKREELPAMRFVAVYYPNESECAAFKVGIAEASRWIEQGLAVSFGKRRALVRLLSKPSGIIARGESCKMGERVMIGNADGIPYFRSIVDNWAWAH